MAGPYYDAIIADYGIARRLSVPHHLRVDVLFPRLPGILVTVRRWLRGEAGADGCDEAVGTGGEEEDEPEDELEEDEEEVLKEDVSSTMEFPDAWYRTAVVGVERATEERQQAIADMAARPRDEHVTDRDGIARSACNAHHILLKFDGFERMRVSTDDPVICERTRAYNRVVPKVVRYMRDFLKASAVERAVVVTIIRNNIAELVCHPSDDAVAMHKWIALYEDPVVRANGKWMRAKWWTESQEDQWAAAFKKRFATPEPYLCCNSDGDSALHRLVSRCSLRVELYACGIEVLLRAGIDPAAVVDRFGRTVLSGGVFAHFRHDEAPICVFVDKIRAVYAQHPEFRFDALLNAHNHDGDTIANPLVMSHSPNCKTARLVLHLCASGLDVDQAIAAETKCVWRHLRTVLAEARAAGLPGNTIITMIWDAVHLPAPKYSRRILADTHAVRLRRRTCKPIDIGRKVSFVAAVNILLSQLIPHEMLSVEPYWFRDKNQGVVNAMRCYPWWSPERHRFHTQSHRACVTAVLLSAQRLDGQASRKCGRLPAEMWFAILSFLPDSRLPLVK